ncbi:MAG: anhydro-N-acetylmuramic acid kinase [Ectothiorhodospiraceae bacterium]|nr:anhydro-N-acetylmuramic acid kinase [Ectothiorhodospiraceae bacterium]
MASPAALYIGLISGTSMDGIDAALVRFRGNRPELLAARSHAYHSTLRQRLLAVGAQTAVRELSELDAAVGDSLAAAVLGLLETTQIPAERITAIGSHGQTVWHAPDGPLANSLQIGDPNRIAERTGITTVADFRRRDMAAGGQGAPLAPAFHQVFFGGNSPSALINLGGIANISLLPGRSGGIVTGFDTGPANVLMDTWAQQRFDLPYDRDGAIAASGQINDRWLRHLLEEPYLQREPPKSTGRELFNGQWLDHRLAHPDAPDDPCDVMVTLCAFTARTVADAVLRWAPEATRIHLCGGGARNPVLGKLLAEALPDRQVGSTAVLGLDPDWVEAAGFAWLAREHLEGRTGNEPAVTGAGKRVVLGAVYPGT